MELDKKNRVTEITELDKVLIEWVLSKVTEFDEKELWERAYLMNHPVRNEQSVKKSKVLADKWHNSAKVQRYIAVVKEENARKEEIKRKHIEQDILASDETIRKFLSDKNDEKIQYEKLIEESGIRGLEETIKELNRLVDEIKEPKDKAQILIKLGEFQGMNKEKIKNNVHQFYTPINVDGCINCALYKLGEELIRKESEKTVIETVFVDMYDMIKSLSEEGKKEAKIQLRTIIMNINKNTYL